VPEVGLPLRSSQIEPLPTPMLDFTKKFEETRHEWTTRQWHNSFCTIYFPYLHLVEQVVVHRRIYQSTPGRSGMGSVL
jgi:hypothetical protein